MAMTETEARLISAGVAYLGSKAGFTFAEVENPDDPAAIAWRVDARDTWYMARDLTQPEHEHVWISEQRMCDPAPWAICRVCGQRTDYAQ